MGAWGPAIYSDDVADDVRTEYKQLLKDGTSDEDALKTIIESNQDFLNDPEDGPVFWFALADTMWKMGRLTPEVRDKALFHINDGKDLQKWEQEAPILAVKRKLVLDKLKAQLLSEQPPRKKISTPRFYHCQWEMGGVYAYPFNSTFADQNGFKDLVLLMQKISESEDYTKYHILPVCRVKVCHKDHIPTTKDAFDALPYWRFRKGEISAVFPDPDSEAYYVKKYGKEKSKEFYISTQYRLIYNLVPDNTSKRVIPKTIFYVGNFGLDNIPEKGLSKEVSVYDNNRRWSVFEEVYTKRLSFLNPEKLEQLHRQTAIEE